MEREWLVFIRLKAIKSQKQVAEEAGITQVYLSQIENGERNPSVDTAKKIAAVLGFEWTRFYDDEAD